ARSPKDHSRDSPYLRDEGLPVAGPRYRAGPAKPAGSSAPTEPDRSAPKAGSPDLARVGGRWLAGIFPANHELHLLTPRSPPPEPPACPPPSPGHPPTHRLAELWMERPRQCDCHLSRERGCGESRPIGRVRSD